MKKSLFDDRAAEWDTPQRRALADAVVASIKKHVLLSPGMEAMDFGAGTGLVTFGLCGMVKEITAVDSSQQMLDVLREKAASRAAGNIMVDEREPEKILASGKRFDLIVSSMTLHHVADVKELLLRFRLLLKPGGTIALADLDSEEGDFHGDNSGVEHFGFARKDLAGLCADAGFADAAIHDAYKMVKTTAGGKVKEYDIFLLTALKR